MDHRRPQSQMTIPVLSEARVKKAGNEELRNLHEYILFQETEALTVP